MSGRADMAVRRTVSVLTLHRSHMTLLSPSITSSSHMAAMASWMLALFRISQMMFMWSSSRLV